MDPIRSISAIASSGMRAQSERLRIVSENVANASSTSLEPGGEPYQRKSISFGANVDPATGVSIVEVSAISEEAGQFKLHYDPTHPGADANGYVKMPNVNPLIELSNMREAARSYEANLNMLQNAREMRQLMIDLLK